VKLTGGSHLSARGREGKREGGLAGVCWADRFGWVGCAKTGRGGKKRGEGGSRLERRERKRV
jgi:hypothetical protein